MKKPPQTSLDPSNPLYDEINRVVEHHISHADMTASDVANTWTLIASEGDMKVYKFEQEDNGTVVQHPLKAVHTVKGITGHELCHHFWDPSVRMEWEVTLETSNVESWLSHDTHVTYQVLKRVWPAAQRDSVFWSTIRHCPSDDDEGPDYWIVVNHSTDCVPISHVTPKCVRLQFNVAMICQTVVQPPSSSCQPITRDHLTCRIQYSANVNPGGWVPASVIQVICKREAPKFLKNFTAYVQEKTKDKEIMF
jgi:collagen type IV alpha-3-binding protein